MRRNPTHIGWLLGVGLTVSCLVLAVAAGIVLRESRELLVRSHVLLDGQRALAGLLEARPVPLGEEPEPGGTHCTTFLERVLAASDALVGDGLPAREELRALRALTLAQAGSPDTLDLTAPSCRATLARWHDYAVKLSRHLAAEEGLVDIAVSRFVDDSLMLLLAATLMGATSALVTLRITYRTVAELRHQDAELARVSWDLVQAQEQAARRLSHELHDDLGQTLAALKGRLGRIGSEGSDVVRREALEIVDQAIGSVREISQLMRPVLLDDLGLAAGIGYLVDRFSRLTGVPATFTDDLGRRLDDDVETQLFRITQEALTNVTRHAEASRLWVRLSLEAGKVVLRIEDNGIGLPHDPKPVSGGLGLTSMRTRASHCGGELCVLNGVEGGTVVMACIPLAAGAGSDPTEGL